MWYMPMHLAVCEVGGSLYRFSLFESICLFYKTSLLACNRFQIWGRVYQWHSMFELRSTKMITSVKCFFNVEPL
jgi:hypothetical protein